MDWKLHLLTLIQLVVPMMSLVLLLLLLQAPIALCPVCTVVLLYCQGFTGTLTFSYLDGELNDIVEGDLVLELQADDDSWTTYTGTVDEVNNTVSYTFNDPVSFKAVTASAADATLTIEEIYPLDSRISVYPNPTANKIYIQGENVLQAELFDLRGRKVKATNQNQIDLSGITSGSFILKVTTDNEKTKSFKIIKR